MSDGPTIIKIDKQSMPKGIMNPKDLSRDEINWKRNALKEHIDTLLESMSNAISEYNLMMASFELNPAKKNELCRGIEQMDEELECVKKELIDLDRA